MILFGERFEQKGMQTLQHLEQSLLAWQMHGVVQQYPEINPEILKDQLSLFKIKYSCQSITDIVTVLLEALGSL